MKKRHFISALVVVSFLSMAIMSPLKVGATSETSVSSGGQYENMSVDELQGLIAKLQKIVQEKKTGNPCFVGNNDLSVGDGEDKESAAGVKRLQEFLKEKGFFKYSSTGYFGKITRSAVMAYQKAAGLEQTGEFNSATRAKIHAAKCQLKIFAEVVKNSVKESVKKPEEKPKNNGVVSSIAAAASGNKITWSTIGTSASGFKVVWSKNTAPVYPTRDGDKYAYLSEPTASSTEIDAFDGAGQYYVRVCEYLGGSCGVYSNQLTVGL